jgi:hypothetical protein
LIDRGVYDSMNVYDSAYFDYLARFTRIAQEDINIDDAISRLYLSNRDQNDMVTVQEALTRLGLFERVGAQQLSFMDYINKIFGVQRTTIDDMTLMDMLYKWGLLNKKGTDLISFQELSGVLNQYKRDGITSITISELLTKWGLMNRDVYSNFVVYDSYEMMMIGLRDVGDNLGIGESIGRFGLFIRYNVLGLRFNEGESEWAYYLVSANQNVITYEGLIRGVTRGVSDTISFIDRMIIRFNRNFRNVQDVLIIHTSQFEGRYSCIIGQCIIGATGVVVPSGGGGYNPIVVEGDNVYQIVILGHPFTLSGEWYRIAQNIVWGFSFENWKTALGQDMFTITFPFLVIQLIILTPIYYVYKTKRNKRRKQYTQVQGEVVE